MSYVRTIIQRGTPFVTLTVLTSLALNRALLARTRREEATQHSLQLTFLHSLLCPSFSVSTTEEALRLSRRARALQLDPVTLGLPAVPMGMREERQTSWRSIFLGDGEKASEGVKKAVERVGEMLRQGGFPIKEERAREKERLLEEEEKDTGEEWLPAWVEADLQAPSRSEDLVQSSEVPSLAETVAVVAPETAPDGRSKFSARALPESNTSSATQTPKPQRRMFI